MDVPSDSTLVLPLDLRHWSSSFGEEKVLDLRVQIATSKSWSDTKAHWYILFTLGRVLARNYSFLVCLPLGNIARKHLSLFVHLQET
jgi:hypothetical protein